MTGQRRELIEYLLSFACADERLHWVVGASELWRRARSGYGDLEDLCVFLLFIGAR